MTAPWFRINVVCLGAVANAYHSLTRTSLRIPNCRLPRENTQSRVLLFAGVLRSQALGGSTMQALYPCVAGLDVHKETVVACVRRIDPRGRVSKEVQTLEAKVA
jgi:hypothetical protein